MLILIYIKNKVIYFALISVYYDSIYPGPLFKCNLFKCNVLYYQFKNYVFMFQVILAKVCTKYFFLFCMFL